MSKIIKVSTDLKVTVHDFPQGTIREQNRQLCELIGNGCEMIEHVMPRRLYNELGHNDDLTPSKSTAAHRRIAAVSIFVFFHSTHDLHQLKKA